MTDDGLARQRRDPVPSGADWEPLLNVRLGALLRDVGVADVSAENRQAGGRQIDVRVRVGHVVVAVEAEIANRAGAIKDAQARLDQGLASRAVAVSYPSGLRVSEFDTSTEVEWAVLPDERFVQGTAEGLAADPGGPW